MAAAILFFIARERTRQWIPKKPSRKALFSSFFSGMFFFAHLWTYFYAAQNTSIASAMILFAMNPLFTALLSIWLLRESFALRLGFAYLFAFAGVYLLVDAHWNSSFQAGNLSALASALLYSLYLISGKRARSELSNWHFTSLAYTVAALCFLISGISQSLSWTSYPVKTWLAIGGTVLLPTLLGHVIFTHLLGSLNINWMSCGKLTEPAMSAAVAYVLFAETIGPKTLGAFVLTSMAILILYQPWKWIKKS
ncbi:MAG: DMT family transporter [Proteobacteria bacterium]|nr:DMT family transporter [Pseudomonadota bacterium]